MPAFLLSFEVKGLGGCSDGSRHRSTSDGLSVDAVADIRDRHNAANFSPFLVVASLVLAVQSIRAFF